MRVLQGSEAVAAPMENKVISAQRMTVGADLVTPAWWYRLMSTLDATMKATNKYLRPTQVGGGDRTAMTLCAVTGHTAHMGQWRRCTHAKHKQVDGTHVIVCTSQVAQCTHAHDRPQTKKGRQAHPKLTRLASSFRGRHSARTAAIGANPPRHSPKIVFGQARMRPGLVHKQDPHMYTAHAIPRSLLTSLSGLCTH